MRPVLCVTFFLGLLVACEPDTKLTSTNLVWMDWAAEVNAAQPFRTRLVVWGVCALNPQFRAGARADQEAVTFSPYFLVDDENIACAARASESLVVVALDTAGTAPALGALVSRTYEMRGSVQGNTRALAILGNGPISTFGEVRVLPNGADSSRRNAAGAVTATRDSASCVRIRPVGLYGSSAGLVLEDQADTTGLSYAFVRGYIHNVPEPICGETRVFHLVTRQ